MNEEEIIKVILDEAFGIHKATGPGMLEKVYKTCLAYKLSHKWLFVKIEKPCPLSSKKLKWNVAIGLTW